jgi:hypothetical protein
MPSHNNGCSIKEKQMDNGNIIKMFWTKKISYLKTMKG